MATKTAGGKLIELRKLQVYERMSEETTAFTADVYVNGIKAGYAKNDGHGGSTYYHPYSGQNALLEKARKYCDALPPKVYPKEEGEKKPFTMKMSLEDVIDDLVFEALKQKEAKKMEKKMENHIMWGVPNGHTYQSVKFKATLEMIQRIQPGKLQEYVDKYKKEFKPGEQFLNTNLEKLGIKI